MKFYRIIISCITSMFVLVFTAESHASDDLCSLAEEVVSTTEKIRGLSKKNSVTCEVQDKKQVQQYIMTALREQMPESLMLAEGTVLQEVGFLPKDFDYEKELVGLYVSQVGGYYDPERATYVMAGWLPAYLQRSVTVHELTHALQDQHFNLEKFLDQTALSKGIARNTDMMLARSALVEGDAMAVMMDYARLLVGAAGIAMEDNINSLLLQNLIGAGLVSSSSGAPDTIFKLLIFPYTSGLRFVHSFLKEGGYSSIDKIFQNPPSTTEEILHPEKYIQRVANDYKMIDLNEISNDYPWTQKHELKYQNVFGEFFLSVLINALCEGACDASKVAKGWGGDSMFLLEDEQSQKVIIWRLAWDTKNDAEEFFDTFRNFYKTKRATVREFKSNSSFNVEFERSVFKQASLILREKEGDLIFFPQ